MDKCLLHQETTFAVLEIVDVEFDLNGLFKYYAADNGMTITLETRYKPLFEYLMLGAVSGTLMFEDVSFLVSNVNAHIVNGVLRYEFICDYIQTPDGTIYEITNSKDEEE